MAIATHSQADDTSPDPIQVQQAGGVAGVAIPDLKWAACEPGFECASAEVPLDYRRPGGRSTSVALLRLPASDPASRIGSLFVNPGGPGGAGTDVVLHLGPQFPAELRKRFDIVGFDPRGVGRSGSLTCWSDAEYTRAFSQVRLRPARQALDRAVRQGRQFGRACETRNDELPFVGTEFVARDLDLLRAAVGDDRLTYLGISYGTYLGTVYANLFPQRVRALYLDGAYDPQRYAKDPYSYDRGQYRALDGAMDRFLDWCAAGACAFGDGDPHRAFTRLMTRLDARPVTTSVDGTVVTANAGTVAYHLMFALNEGKAAWPRIADELRQADRDKTGPLITRAVDSSLFNVNVAVECNDRTYPRDSRLLKRKLKQAVQQSPLLGPAIAYGPPAYDHSHAPACVQWPAPRLSRYAGSYSATTASPVLIVGTVGDPDTPYRDAVALERTLPNSRLFTFKAEGHVGLLRSACVTGHAISYLVEQRLPAPGTVCADEPPAQRES